MNHPKIRKEISMETIIQQITLELGRKITKKALSEGLNDIDAFSHDIFSLDRKSVV